MSGTPPLGAARWPHRIAGREPEEVPIAIVGGLDIHGRQITYDWIDTDTGETRRGQLSPTTRLQLRGWLEQFHSQPADFALEAITGWRFVAEELQRAGCRARLAEQGRPNRPPSTIPPVVGRRRRPIDGLWIGQTDSYVL